MPRSISFIVPTLNGENRLRLLCDWLQIQRFTGKLITVDGSEKSKKPEFDRYSFVNYIHAPKSSPHMAFFMGLNEVTTDYVALLGDDDFPMIGNLTQLSAFLDANPEFDSACSAAGFVHLDMLYNQEGRESNIFVFLFFLKNLFAARYDADSDLSSSEVECRLREIVKQYVVTQFFVTRTEVVRRINPLVFAKFNDADTSEIANNIAHAISARTKKLPGLYLLRGLAGHRPNNNKDHPRHSLDMSNIVERDVENYLQSLNLSNNIKNIAKRAILAHRYAYENRRVLGIKPEFSKFRYISSQIRRLVFVLKFQSIEKMVFLVWLIKVIRKS